MSEAVCVVNNILMIVKREEDDRRRYWKWSTNSVIKTVIMEIAIQIMTNEY